MKEHRALVRPSGAIRHAACFAAGLYYYCLLSSVLDGYRIFNKTIFDFSGLGLLDGRIRRDGLAWHVQYDHTGGTAPAWDIGHDTRMHSDGVTWDWSGHFPFCQDLCFSLIVLLLLFRPSLRFSEPWLG